MLGRYTTGPQGATVAEYSRATSDLQSVADGLRGRPMSAARGPSVGHRHQAQCQGSGQHGGRDAGPGGGAD